ncbi:MAG: AsmA family protein [Thermodesulfobacteriota bacterium]|nr:AsmA family protein [Thermodesulfobacteriota bacterium]
MKKAIKISVIAATALMVLIIAATIIVILTVDPNDYKDEIAEVVKEKTGRDLTFKGDIELSLFPWLGVELGAVSLSNAPGFGDEPFAQIENADIKVKLLPLLSKDIQIKGIKIQGLSVSLGRNKKGVSNWDDLTKPKEPGKEQDTGAAPKAETGVKALTVGGIALENARIVWDDASTGDYYRLEDTNLVTSAVSPGAPLDLQFSTSLDAKKLKISGKMELSAEVNMDKAMKHLALKGLNLAAQLDGDAFPAGKLDANLSSDVSLDLDKKSVQIAELKLEAYGLSGSGDVEVQNFDQEPQIAANLSLAQFSPKALLKALGMPAMETEDKNALTKASLSLTAKASAKHLDLKKLSLNLDETKITGNAKVMDFEKPDVFFRLKADTLDVDRYLPPKPPEKAKDEAKDEAPKKAKKEAPEKDSDLPKEQLRSLVMDGEVLVGSLKVVNLRMREVRVVLTAKDGLIRVDPLETNLYSGKCKAGLVADFREKTTKSSLALGLSQVNLGALLKDLLGEEKMTGTAKVNLALSGQGEEIRALQKTLNGHAALSVIDGAFRGFQIIPAAVKKQAVSHDPEKRAEKLPKEQKFKTLSATMAVANGVVKNNDLALRADHLSVDGHGIVDLAKEEIDYRVKADITAIPVIPFTIKGPFSDIGYSLDTAEFLKGIVKQVIKLPEKVGKGVLDLGKGAAGTGKDAVESIGGAIKGGLEKLFGGGRKKEKEEKDAK